MNTSTEQQTLLADIQMPMNRAPAARLEVVSPQKTPYLALVRRSSASWADSWEQAIDDSRPTRDRLHCDSDLREGDNHPERERAALARSRTGGHRVFTPPLADTDDAVRQGSAWRSAWWGRQPEHQPAAAESACLHRVPGAAEQYGNTPR